MPDIASALNRVVGAAHFFAGETIEERYTTDFIGNTRSRPGFVVRPANTEDIVAIVKIAGEFGVPITPLGGCTGLVGGGLAEEGSIVLSLERMNHILEIDAGAMTMTVEAGAVLQMVHEAAEREGMLMPLDLGARGSATIGGNIATNAGGVRVLRWGTMRDMVIGLEAVLADGSVVRAMGKFLKDNAGYNWKHLLIGSEGTLGIVTKALLRLRPLPTTTSTALVAVENYEMASRLLRHFEGELAGQLSSFELMEREFYDYVSEFQRSRRPPPLDNRYPLYALIESMGASPDQDEARFAEVLSAGLERGLAVDAVIAQSGRERNNLWAVRDDLADAFRPLYPLFGFDVSMALADIPGFVDHTRDRLRALYPDGRFFFYGHAGDGNLHVTVCIGRGDHEAERAVDEVVYGEVRNVGGSIAAEHGIGRTKLPFIGMTRSEAELELMRKIKRALDPANIMNPNTVVPF